MADAAPPSDAMEVESATPAAEPVAAEPAEILDDDIIAVGIDLGTTYSCVGLWRTALNDVEILANDQGNKTTPSYVAFTEGERLIGEAAKNQVHPPQTAPLPRRSFFFVSGLFKMRLPLFLRPHRLH